MEIINFKKWLINEINWTETPDNFGFSDVSATCLPVEIIVDDLNKQLERLKKSPNDRGKFPRNSELKPKKMLLPQLTTKTIHTAKDTIEGFIKKITKEPKTIFDIGIKSEHSNQLDQNSFTVNTGIPALRSIVYDMQQEKFYAINTCKGAGSCIMNCYALKGFYILHDGKNLKLQQRINLLVNDPEKYYLKALEELKAIALKEVSNGKILKIRWNDAGDWFSKTYYNIAVKITNDLKSIKLSLSDFNSKLLSSNTVRKKIIDFKDKIVSYGYTKQGEYIELGKKDNIILNFSTGAKQSELAKIDINSTKMSVIVNKSVFDKVFKRNAGQVKFAHGMNKEILRQLITNWAIENNYINYGDKLLFTDELIKIPENKNPFWNKGKKYNVIILPKGDSDLPAQRKDVHYTFLMEH